jgi:hypothetical protein
MRKNVVEIKFDSAEAFLNELLPWSSRLGLSNYIFRGHSNANYPLLPTSVRGDTASRLGRFHRVGLQVNNVMMDDEFSLASAEYQLLREFYRRADERGLHVPKSDMLRERLHQQHDTEMHIRWINGEKWLPVDMLEAAALAQHYGIPTRLLDWTYDPFVAAFFSSRPGGKDSGELCIWALNTMVMGSIMAHDKNFPFAMVTPHYSGNPNLAAQKGLFTHWAVELPSFLEATKKAADSTAVVVDRRPLDVLIENYLASSVFEVGQPVFIKMVLPRTKALDLARHLRALGYGPARLFPGYGGVFEEMLDREML